jgi:formylglycine-generating enzyme required for sulfatase activity
MSDFFKKFLLEDPRRLSPTGRYVALAAFGKHPGWDDHVEDLGLETESLNFAKTVLYVNGIGGQIDSGAWEKLEPAQQLPAFNHLFLWQRSGQILLGRLWSSSDGKGRTRYPMVVCAHFVGVPLGWALKQALPALAELEEGCVKTTSAADVRALLARKRAALREAVQAADGRGEYAPVSPEALHRILQPAARVKPEGFFRVLYQIQSQMGAFAPGNFNARANPAAIRAQQIRVPAAAGNPEEALLFWTRFFLRQVDASMPLLLALPLDADWLDVTAGEPESHEFFSLRASPKAVPMVSEVPYTLDGAFLTKAAAFIESFQRGETRPADLQPAAPAAVALPAPAKGGWRRWLGVGVIMVLCVVAVKMLFPKSGKQRETAKPSGAQLAVVEKKGDPLTGAPSAAETVSPPSAPAASETSNLEAARARDRIAAEAEAARVAEEKKKADALVAAANLKAATEAAAKEQERQTAEAARVAKEKEAAMQQVLKEQERKQAEAAAKVKADEEARTRAELAASSLNVNGGTAQDNAVLPASASATARGEMTNSIGMVLVAMPSGIWVGKYEVTQAEYRRVMWSNPSKFVNDRHPVERVTWHAANAFCQKLTEKERPKLPAGKVYSLPTEKEWNEFLGSQKFDDLPGGGVTGTAEPAVVGQSSPSNSFGLFDVLGNVWEWCLDDATGGQKVLKGGAFDSAKYNQTLAPDMQNSNCGFRCVLTAR